MISPFYSPLVDIAELGCACDCHGGYRNADMWCSSGLIVFAVSLEIIHESDAAGLCERLFESAMIIARRN
ncbi:hypothetical protein RRSWK_03988 [Rhodopirellula sp. SWK7]|nr:hypothetical protein RRSWK_03988 [Rhodopirellula sp. SWK7]